MRDEPADEPADDDGDSAVASDSCDPDDPGAEDADCDGVPTADDCDDHDPHSTTRRTDADCDGAPAATDCNDDDATIFPGAQEACDGVDRNCDGTADNGLARLYVFEGPYRRVHEDLPQVSTSPGYGVRNFDHAQFLAPWDMLRPDDGDTLRVFFDHEGRLTRAALDESSDGSEEDIWTVSYGEHGWTEIRIVRGTTVGVFTATYEPDGSKSRETHDIGDDGAFEWVRAWSRETVDGAHIVKTDLNDDNLFEHWRRTTLDEQSNILLQEVARPPNPSWFAVYEALHDDHGNLIGARRDYDEDGTWDVSFTETWEEDGRVLVTREDLGADGVVDRETRVTYTRRGQQALVTLDDPADGIIDEREERVYDTRGNELLYQRDDDGDGTWDIRWVQLYNARDQWVSQAIDIQADGYYDEFAKRTFDSWGRWVLQRFSNDAANGNMIETADRTDDDQMAELRRDFDGDGTIDEVQTWQYDSAGIPVARTINTMIYDQVAGWAMTYCPP